MAWTKVVTESAAGKIAQEAATAILATTATNVVITDNESTSEANAIVFVADADIDGNTSIGLESDGTLTYNPSTGGIASTLFTGAVTGDVTGDITGDVTGNADTATLATNVTAVDSAAADATYYPALVDGLTGTQGIETESGLTYNPSTAMLTTAGFTGALTGNASTVTNGVYTSRVTSSGLGWVIDEDDMSTDSATKVPTQQSVKKYVDDQIDTADALSELTDTTISGTPADNEILAWDGSSAWINQTAAEAGLQAAGTYYTDAANATYWQTNAARTIGNASATLTVAGNLTVSGTTTTINTANITVEDKNIAVADGASSLAAASGAGLSVAHGVVTSSQPALLWIDSNTTARNLTGWSINDNADDASHEIAVMSFSTAAGTGTGAGVGSFHYDTSAENLYIRTS